MWQRVLDWLKRGNPNIQHAPETLEDLARKTEGAIDGAVPDRARSVRMSHALYLLILLLLAICVVGYWRGWHKGLVRAASSLIPVATKGGVPAHTAPQVPAMEKAIRSGQAKPRAVVRPVQTIPTENLPLEEQARIPAVIPAAGPDNVVRSPELTTTAVVPASRGEIHVRAYLMPSGAVQTTLEPQREPFWGWAWQRVELEGRYGVLGNTSARGTGRWLPLRAGDFHAGIEGSVGTEQDGTIRGEGMVIIRYEPFRDSYR